MQSLIMVRYVWQILGTGAFLLPSPIGEQPQKCPSWISLIFLKKIYYAALSPPQHSMNINVIHSVPVTISHHLLPVSNWLIFCCEKFDTSSKKEMKMIKTQIFWWKTTKNAKKVFLNIK